MKKFIHLAIDQETIGISVVLAPFKGNSAFYSKMKRVIAK
jgi:hypothetical protein